MGTQGYVPISPSTRRQEVDRVHDRHGRHTILRAQIDRPDAANDLRGEIRRIHVSRLQRAHRHAAVRFDRQAQNHLAFQGWVIAQLPVVQPVERRLVAVEHDLYFFVGACRTWPAACLRSVGAGDRGDRADCAAYPHTTNPASSATASASAAATCTATAVAPASASSATASHTAAQRGDVDATARSRRIARQHRACRELAYVIGCNVPLIGSERQHDDVLCQARELVLECQDAGLSHLRLWLWLHRKAHLRTWWQFRFARQVWTCRGVRSRFPRGCRCPRWGPGLIRPSRHRKRDGSRLDRDLRWTIEDDVEFFVGGLAAKQHLRRYEHQPAQHEDMEPEARRYAAGRRSPGCFENALHFHGCHQATTSIGRNKFDLQILNARLRDQFRWLLGEDRKSTRLNSSHITTSYPVFCFKKKNAHDLHGA